MLIILVGALTVALLIFSLTYLDVRRRLQPVSPPIVPLPDEAPFKRVDFYTEDGQRIAAWYAPPATKSGEAVLLLHGHSGNRDQLLPHAAYLLEAGYGTLLIDFRHHGDSSGEISTMGAHEIRDARAAYRFLAGQPGVRAIAVWGHSMGGAVAAQLMREVEAAGLFIDATFADFPSLVRAGVRQRGLPAAGIADLYIWLFSRLSGADMKAHRPIDHLAEVDTPALLFHGDLDPAIPLDHARRIAATNDKIRLSIFAGGGHSDLYELDPARYQREALAYLASAYARARNAWRGERLLE